MAKIVIKSAEGSKRIVDFHPTFGELGWLGRAAVGVAEVIYLFAFLTAATGGVSALPALLVIIFLAVSTPFVILFLKRALAYLFRRPKIDP